MRILPLASSASEPTSEAGGSCVEAFFKMGTFTVVTKLHNLILKFVHFIFDSNSINQGGNIERRDAGDSAGVNSKLSDVQTAIESLTHSVNHMSTQQLVRKKLFTSYLYLRLA